MGTVFTAETHIIAGLGLGYDLLIGLAVEVSYDVVQAIVHAAQAHITVGQQHIVIQVFNAATGPWTVGVLYAIPTVLRRHEI